MLAREGKYDDCIFHRLVPDFMVGIFNISRKNSHISWINRFKLVIQQARDQEDSPTGELLLEMSTILKALRNTTLGVWSQWRIMELVPMGL